MGAEGWALDAALFGGLYGLLAGLLVPALIARIPEPVGDAGAEVDAAVPPDAEQRVTTVDRSAATPEADGDLPSPDASEPKEPYADIARLRGLRWKASLATAVVAGLVGARVGFAPALAHLLYLVPVGVALAVVDWRTRLLPTKVIAPSYAVVGLLVALAAWQSGDWDSLLRALWGWLVAGGTFFALWFLYPKGMGYGDVRLSGVLGIALGHLGWAELLSGVYAGFLLGGVGGLLLSTLRIVDRKAYPFGPFMLAGALLGVLFGPDVAAWYA